MKPKPAKNDDQKLIDAARAAREKAHAPYSNFRVGAALRTKSGKIYSGCNIENASYGLTLCAERVAIFKAMSEGEREFDAIAVVCDTEKLTPPCGLVPPDHLGILRRRARDSGEFERQGRARYGGETLASAL